MRWPSRPGTFLCIALSDLLPELQFHSHDRLKLSVALLVGFALMAATSAIEPPRATPDRAAASGPVVAHAWRETRDCEFCSASITPSERRRRRGRVGSSVRARSVAVTCSITKDGRDPLVQIQHAGLVEKHFPTLCDHLFDDLVDGVIEGGGSTTRIGQKPIARGVQIGWIFEVGLDKQYLTTIVDARPARPDRCPTRAG